MGWECFCVVGFDLGPLLQGGTRILHLQYFFKYVLTYFLHLNSYLVTFLHNTICRAQLFCPFLLSASEFLSNMLFNYHLMYFCTALSLIIMLSSHYHLHKSKTLSQLTQCPFTGTLLLIQTSLQRYIYITKIHGLLQLIIICILHNCAISIDSSSPINKFYSVIIFSLLINAAILLLNFLVLTVYLYIHFLALKSYFIHLNIIWTII